MRAMYFTSSMITSQQLHEWGTVEKVVRQIHALGQEGVQFATFPETVVPYYPYFSFIQTPYQIIAGREHLKLLDQAVTVPIRR